MQLRSVHPSSGQVAPRPIRRQLHPSPAGTDCAVRPVPIGQLGRIVEILDRPVVLVAHQSHGGDESMIEVTRTSAVAFKVEVIDDTERRRYEVAATPGTLERLAPRHALEVVIEAAFRFLLDRESKHSILPEFDFTVVASYYPEFEAELPRYLNR